MYNFLSELKKYLMNKTDEISPEFRHAISDASKRQSITLEKAKVKKITKLPKQDQYVYDISMKNKEIPWFFANDILVHNTDSSYFTAWPEIGKDVEAKRIPWTKDDAVSLYTEISEEVSNTFPKFLNDTFNIPLDKGAIIKSSRELVGEIGLFIKKKRYAMMYYDKEGKRVDIDGKPGKLKITGLDLRRSDTPKYMQAFLEKVLYDLLSGHSEEDIIAKIREFKKKVVDMKPWERGAPKSVNNLTTYREREEQYIKDKLSGRAAKLSIPGHVRASMNWNLLREQHHDLGIAKIVDGQKIAICPLKSNDYGFTSIAYPVDEKRLPQWFKDLPFDEESMMEKVVDKKLLNLLGVLKWDLSKADPQAEFFESLFEF